MNIENNCLAAPPINQVKWFIKYINECYGDEIKYKREYAIEILEIKDLMVGAIIGEYFRGWWYNGNSDDLKTTVWLHYDFNEQNGKQVGGLLFSILCSKEIAIELEFYELVGNIEKIFNWFLEWDVFMPIFIDCKYNVDITKKSGLWNELIQESL